VHSDKSGYVWQTASVALDEAVFVVGEYMSSLTILQVFFFQLTFS